MLYSSIHLTQKSTRLSFSSSTPSEAKMFFPLQFLKSQLFVRLPYPTSNFSGQTIIVTGSNTGLGKEAVRHLVRLGAAKVIIAVRSTAKGQAAAEDILQSTKAKDASVIELWQLDFADPQSIKAFAKRAQGLDRLDGVIQNAGILPQKFEYIDAWEQESTIAINVLAPALFGTLMLPILQSSARKTGLRGRLAFNGSDLHYIATFKEGESEGPALDVLRRRETTDMGAR